MTKSLRGATGDWAEGGTVEDRRLLKTVGGGADVTSFCSTARVLSVYAAETETNIETDRKYNVCLCVRARDCKSVNK